MKSVIIIASLMLIVGTVTTAQAEDVPDWVKNNAKWLDILVITLDVYSNGRWIIGVNNDMVNSF